MPIQIGPVEGRSMQITTSFKKNWKHYLQEALGLGIFMISACFFSTLFFSDNSFLSSIPSKGIRDILMGAIMGITALIIFYSPLTSPSGAQINPAVTLSFLRLRKMCRYDAIFYIGFQFIGGTVAVLLMQQLMGKSLINPPVNCAITTPGKFGVAWALIVELTISFITMLIVLTTSSHQRLKKYTRIFAAGLVCIWVVVAGPVSGFGMNPARSFASAFAANNWTAFWIYLFAPIGGMMLATECHLRLELIKIRRGNRKAVCGVDYQIHK
jgi:aquaporin Z